MSCTFRDQFDQACARPPHSVIHGHNHECYRGDDLDCDGDNFRCHTYQSIDEVMRRVVKDQSYQDGVKDGIEQVKAKLLQLGMLARDFCYWLQGYFELSNLEEVAPLENKLTPDQVACIKRHLNMVFAHDIDPSMGSPEHQKVLHTIHNLDSLGPKINC